MAIWWFAVCPICKWVAPLDDEDTDLKELLASAYVAPLDFCVTCVSPLLIVQNETYHQPHSSEFLTFNIDIELHGWASLIRTDSRTYIEIIKKFVTSENDIEYWLE